MARQAHSFSLNMTEEERLQRIPAKIIDIVRAGIEFFEKQAEEEKQEIEVSNNNHNKGAT